MGFIISTPNHFKNREKEMPKIYQRLTTEIEEYILQCIDEHQLEADAKLPTERELSTALNVTRVTLRSGLQALIDKGIIYSQRGSGYFVCPPKVTRSLVSFSFPFADDNLAGADYRTEELDYIPEQVKNIATNFFRDSSLNSLTFHRFKEIINDVPISLTYTAKEDFCINRYPDLFKSRTVPPELTQTQFIRIFPHENGAAEKLLLKPTENLLLISNFIYLEHKKIACSLSLCVGTRVDLVSTISLPGDAGI